MEWIIISLLIINVVLLTIIVSKHNKRIKKLENKSHSRSHNDVYLR